MNIKLLNVVPGDNLLVKQYNVLNEYVMNNWEGLKTGAVRAGLLIEADYYAPERVQIGATRLHARIGVKYANGVKYTNLESLRVGDLIQAVEDIKVLISAAEKVVECNLEIVTK